MFVRRDSFTGSENGSSLGSLHGKGSVIRCAAPHLYICTHTTSEYRNWCLNQAYSDVKLLLSDWYSVDFMYN